MRRAARAGAVTPEDVRRANSITVAADSGRDDIVVFTCSTKKRLSRWTLVGTRRCASVQRARHFLRHACSNIRLSPRSGSHPLDGAHGAWHNARTPETISDGGTKAAPHLPSATEHTHRSPREPSARTSLHARRRGERDVTLTTRRECFTVGGTPRLPTDPLTDGAMQLAR